MRPTRIIVLVLIVWAACAAYALAADDAWPEFRGPTQQGHAPGADPPLEWSDTRNIRFKTAIPGRGWSSPVILGNQVWMTTASEDGTSLRAVCVDRQGGATIHNEEVFHVANPTRINAFNSYASPSPVIEEGRLYVCFGSEGLACLDTATGKPIWENRQFHVQHMEGAGSSPVIYDNLLIVNYDGTDSQFIAAVDKRTGKQAWKTLRSTPFPLLSLPPYRKAYGTPLIIRASGKDQLISPAARRVFSYDPTTGHELWYVDFEPPAYNTAPRPVYADGVLYACTGYDRPQLWAIRIDAKSIGDCTATHVLWKYTRGAASKPSPLLLGTELYTIGDYGIAKCFDAKTGEELWHSRIGNAYSASPVEANGRLYFFGEGGRTVVLEAGRTFKTVADNFLEGGGCLATPAFSGKAIFLRSKTHLYRIEG